MTQKKELPKNIPPKIILNTQYVKDLSFENPNSPKSLVQVSNNPNINFNIDIAANHFSYENYEIVLSINVTAVVKDKNDKGVEEDVTMFIAELKYAGMFQIEANKVLLETILLVDCPTLLFPFARRIIADATRDGGFPPLMMDPVNFYHLYQQNKKDNKKTH